MIEWPEGEAEPDQLLAGYTAGRHLVHTDGRPGQTALADRARLSRTQARGRTRPLRRTRLAGISPSRHALHRRLRVPDLREGDNSPLRTCRSLAPHAICRSRWLPTRRCCRCARNATCRIPSQRCAFVWHVPCSARCPDVPAAAASVRDRRCGMNDAVGLTRNPAAGFASSVIPAQAGIQPHEVPPWIPAFARE